MVCQYHSTDKMAEVFLNSVRLRVALRGCLISAPPEEIKLADLAALI